MSNEMFGKEAIYELLKASREVTPMAKAIDWSISDTLAKSTEELGEFAEAVMVRSGKLKNKMAEHEYAPVDEAADVLICLMDSLTRLYPDKSPSELYCLFLYYVEKKTQKWVNKLTDEFRSL